MLRFAIDYIIRLGVIGRRPVRYGKALKQKKEDAAMIKTQGYADDIRYDYECELIERDSRTIRLRTISDPPHEIVGMVRHTDIYLDQPTHDGGPVILNILFDGEFVAIAEFREQENDITLLIHEY